MQSPVSRAGLVLAFVIAADQVSKQLVIGSISIGAVRKLLPGLELVDTENTGVAFSVGSGGAAVVLFAVAVAVGAIAVYFFRHRERPLLWLPTGMMLGGALGNVVDRLRHGAVIDFIKLPHWPAFNVADASITLGVFVLLYVLSRETDPSPA